MKNRFVTLSILTSFCLVGTASASVSGTLNVQDCAGGGVTVTATLIDWLLPVGGGTGCLQTVAGTAVTASGLTLGPGVSGSILDISAAAPAMPGFMTFSSSPPLSFDLTALGPGSNNTICAASFLTGSDCSVFTGSPFVLTPDGTGTTVTLAAFGTVTDGTIPSMWSGEFTILFPGLAPLDIQNFYLFLGDPTKLGLGCVNGSCTMIDSGIIVASLSASSGPGYSARFTVTATPEPFPMLLSGIGLSVVTILRRRKNA